MGRFFAKSEARAGFVLHTMSTALTLRHDPIADLVPRMRMKAGDYSRFEGGSEHGPLSTREGCLLLVMHSTRDELVA